MPRKKRSRGGQPGNQNARKHGFYAKNLSPQESCEYWNTINTQGVSPEVAVLRLKIQSVLRNAPGNYPVLRDISKLLVKHYTAQNPLGKKENRVFKTVIRNIIKAAAGDKDLIERIVAESMNIVEKSNNESSLNELIGWKNQKTK